MFIIESPTIAHVPDGQADWLSLSSWLFLTSILCVSLGCSLVLSRSFFSFVSVAIFSCDGELRDVFWSYSLFLFPDSFELFVDVSIQCLFHWRLSHLICVLTTEFTHLEVHCHSRLCEKHFWWNFLFHFSFLFQFSENESLFQDLLLFFYLRVFGVHLDCIDLFSLISFCKGRTRLF